MDEGGFLPPSTPRSFPSLFYIYLEYWLKTTAAILRDAACSLVSFPAFRGKIDGLRAWEVASFTAHYSLQLERAFWVTQSSPHAPVSPDLSVACVLRAISCPPPILFH